ncbi:MAG: deoxyribodipyrimidine photo-lyase, partial [Candidatus Competibacterales bacterium]|nr:deoxyribodipyrimidine photo-lyase [Candidatus Competibacterales bacterium]
MSTAIVWLRRDLRLQDNPALRAAAAGHEQVVPVYIHAPDEERPWDPGGAGRWWLHRSLDALTRQLHRRHSRLILRTGPSKTALASLIEETGAGAVYWNRLYEPAVIGRDRAIKTALRAQGVTARSFNAALLWEPWQVRTGNGGPYKVFTPFWKTACRLTPDPPGALERLPGVRRWPESLPLAALGLLPRVHWHDHMEQVWQPGESGARERLARFLETGLAGYAERRDRPDCDGVSRLSPHLHWGEISPRQIWQAVAEASDGDPLSQTAPEAYLRELGWREFAHHVLYHFPHSDRQSLDARFEDYPWQRDEQLLAAWQSGRT